MIWRSSSGGSVNSKVKRQGKSQLVINDPILPLGKLLTSKLTKALLVLGVVKMVKSQFNHWTEASVACSALARFNLIVAVRVLHSSDDLYSPTSNIHSGNAVFFIFAPPARSSEALFSLCIDSFKKGRWLSIFIMMLRPNMGTKK